MEQELKKEKFEKYFINLLLICISFYGGYYMKNIYGVLYIIACYTLGYIIPIRRKRTWGVKIKFYKAKNLAHKQIGDLFEMLNNITESQNNKELSKYSKWFFTIIFLDGSKAVIWIVYNNNNKINPKIIIFFFIFRHY